MQRRWPDVVELQMTKGSHMDEYVAGEISAEDDYAL